MLFDSCKICGKGEKYEKPIHLQIIKPFGNDISIINYKVCEKCYDEKISPVFKPRKT